MSSPCRPSLFTPAAHFRRPAFPTASLRPPFPPMWERQTRRRPYASPDSSWTRAKRQCEPMGESEAPTTPAIPPPQCGSGRRAEGAMRADRRERSGHHAAIPPPQCGSGRRAEGAMRADRRERSANHAAILSAAPADCCTGHRPGPAKSPARSTALFKWFRALGRAKSATGVEYARRSWPRSTQKSLTTRRRFPGLSRLSVSQSKKRGIRIFLPVPA